MENFRREKVKAVLLDIKQEQRGVTAIAESTYDPGAKWQVVCATPWPLSPRKEARGLEAVLDASGKSRPAGF